MPQTHDTSPAVSDAKNNGFDVMCIGTALMDHLVFADFETIGQLGLALGTMALVDSAAIDQLRASVGEGREVSGGSEANTAAGIASFGGHPGFIGAVGNDAAGARYRADLEAAGVAVHLAEVPVGDGEATGSCFVIVTPDGERTMSTSLGVGQRLSPSVLAEARLDTAEIVYFTAYALDFPHATALFEGITERRRSGSMRLALSLADPFAVERHQPALEQLVASDIDYLFANEFEAMALTGVASAEKAIGELQRSGLVAFITRGAAGVLVASAEEIFEVPAQKVENVVDATGAGDLFTAGALFGITHGMTLQDAAKLGVLGASEVIGHLGARPQVSLAELARTHN